MLQKIWLLKNKWFPTCIFKIYFLGLYTEVINVNKLVKFFLKTDLMAWLKFNLWWSVVYIKLIKTKYKE